MIPKYEEFLKFFPTQKDLAKANLGDVLRAWSGLGYNRRAKYLHEAAKSLTKWDYDDLVSCKGIGANTAAAVCVYAYNHPLVFIETNIRTVYIHHFFGDKAAVSDKELLPIIKDTIDQENPREWYWALMDYGSLLKKQMGNISRQSRHYAKQSVFQGSKRQLRGQVLRLLGQKPQSLEELRAELNDERLPAVLADLANEEMIIYKNDHYQLDS